MATVNHIQIVPEAANIHQNTGMVTLTRVYDADAYPSTAMGLSFVAPFTGPATGAGVPLSIDIDVQAVRIVRNSPAHGQPSVDTPTQETQTVRLFAESMEYTSRSALAVETDSRTSITVKYVGLITGIPWSDSFDLGTETALITVDLADEAIYSTDAEQNVIFDQETGDPINLQPDDPLGPKGIGAKAEGTNRQVPKGSWQVFENISADQWEVKRNLIAQLIGTVNEDNWKSTLRGRPFPEGFWLYLGAVFEPVGRHYFRLTHSFDMANGEVTIFGPSANHHYYRWRYFKDVTVDASVTQGEATTAKRIERQYGNEVNSRIYPIAGKNNVIAGRNLTNVTFADLEL